MLKTEISKIEEQTILVAPLDWGLGHATRCVPVIDEMLNQKKRVVIAAYGSSFYFLEKYFPQLQIIMFQGVSVKYSKSNSQAWAMMLQLPSILTSIVKEHRELKRIIKQFDIDAIVSDNRFGLWNKEIKSIYITHQIGVKISNSIEILNKIAYTLHSFFINRYDICWIPDEEGNNNLSGELAHKYKLPTNAVFIGTLSRFNRSKTTQN